jgi:hypothetical protein
MLPEPLVPLVPFMVPEPVVPELKLVCAVVSVIVGSVVDVEAVFDDDVWP